MTRLTRIILRFVLLLTAIVMASALTEAILRMWYRDEGRSTLSGPGGRQFQHDTIDGELRGRRDVGPKAAGLPRIMVVGDSITYGLGVRDWRDTWPELLARSLDASGRKHELAVFAMPGDDMPQHVEKMREWPDRVRPDVLIYQWYVNDIEVITHRPDGTRRWQRWPWHRSLRGSSYLYYVADYRLSQLLPPPERSYVDYLLTDFAPGSLEWAEFERAFHEFATRAAHNAPRRIMALYPQVPFRDHYPLQPIHDRMHAIAGPHNLHIPPAAWTRSGGTMTPQQSAPWKQVFAVPPRTPGGVIETAEYVFASGTVTIELVVEKSNSEDGNESLATFQVIDAVSNRAVMAAPVRIGSAATRLSVAMPVTLTGAAPHRIRFRVQSTGHDGWSLADIAVPVDYGFEVVDLAQPLNSFQTHASAFDAHPNAAAHRVMAEQLYAALTAR